MCGFVCVSVQLYDFKNYHTVKLAFFFLVYNSMNFNICIVLCYAYHNQTQNSSVTLKNSPVLSTFTSTLPPPTLSPGSHWSVLHHHNFVFLIMSYEWTHIIHKILPLALFTQCNAFKVPLSCCVYQSSFIHVWWIGFHCIDVSCPCVIDRLSALPKIFTS